MPQHTHGKPDRPKPASSTSMPLRGFPRRHQLDAFAQPRHGVFNYLTGCDAMIVGATLASRGIGVSCLIPPGFGTPLDLAHRIRCAPTVPTTGCVPRKVLAQEVAP